MKKEKGNENNDAGKIPPQETGGKPAHKPLPVTKKLLEKLKGLKEKDPNIYPMW